MKVLDVELPGAYTRKQNGPRVVVGVDTESLVSGYAFLICDSRGRHSWIRSFDDVVRFFDYEDYAYCLLATFNLDFDAGVLLKWLGREVCTELVNNTHVSLASCQIEYIPSKYLQFRFGRRFVRVFDVAQFFRGSLDYCAKQYLGMSKINVGSKEFTEADYGRQDLVVYCAKDAVLAGGLGEYVVTAFDKVGVKVQSLSSPASILESYVLDQLGLRNPVFGVPEGALEFAARAFSGAWFENFKAGTFSNTYRYDVISAYPSVVRDLVDLRQGYWIHSKVRPSDALYGYVRAKVGVPKMCVSPIIFKSVDGSIFRPHGIWTTYLTVQELDWLGGHGGHAEILDAWWFISCTKIFKWRGVVDKFFVVKRGGNDMEKWSAKIALVGMYGKFLQRRGDVAGRLYNPVYAAEITSRIRLKIVDACMQAPDKIIAIMSDCVVSDGSLNLSLGKKIGDWSGEGPSSSLWIGPAQYEAGGQDRRFRHIPWKSLLESDPKVVDYEVVRDGPLTLLQGVRMNRFDDVGVWVKQSVTFNIRKLNWKRFWPRRPSCGRDLLNNQYDSVQLHVGSRLKEEDMRLWEL